MLKKIMNENENNQICERPWGKFEILAVGPGYKVKRIQVSPKAKLSLQSHNRRSEHWVVVQGTAWVTNGDNKIILQKNESTFIPIGNKHRLENNDEGILEIIEVQNGDYLEEDDIIRYDDIYNRTK